MAENRGAWGIDIGQAGLKAIRLEINDATEQVVATAFDYIAHPKILSQPDAIPEELIAQALEKFLKQNNIENDWVAISVPGQSALARFIQLPPVEASKVSEIVKYEARQQIPFALEDVVWDYQTLGKGTEESGFLLEAEVGLFAMKRDQVMNQLKPFTNAGVEVELIQIAPLALYNFLSFDQLGIRLGDEVIAMDSYTILLDMGADNTTLLVSNGQKIWIRNVPIGGNHFTRALTKEMKLTFAKAEHLKCNATKSPDPRAVFQALRPVFNDYVSEIQRSIGYFSSVNRDAKIARVVGLGNGFKLAGLQKFLQQNLQYEVERVDSFSAISADGFKDPALFQENILSFPVCYGAALQALRQTRIRTSLLPKEITTARTIARKKPWAVAAASLLMAGLATSAFGYARVYKSVSKERFKTAEETVTAVNKEAVGWKNEYGSETSKCKEKKLDGEKLVGNLDHRADWLKLYKAIDECLPHDDIQKQPDIRLQNRIRIFSIQTRWVPDLKTGWFDHLSGYALEHMYEPDKKAPPSGGGYVVTLVGDHWHDETMGKARPEPGAEDKYLHGRWDGFLRKHFIDRLDQWTVPAQDHSGEVPVRALGITHVAVVSCPIPKRVAQDPLGRMPPRRRGQNGGMSDEERQLRRMQRRGDKGDGGGVSFSGDAIKAAMERATFGGGTVAGNASTDPQKPMLEHTEFTVQFLWNPAKPPQKPTETTAVAQAPTAAPGKATSAGSPAAGTTNSNTAAAKK